MIKGRIRPLLSPAILLYLVADAAAAGGGLDPLGAAVAVAVFVGSLAPLFVRSSVEPGARRVGLLGVACGAALLPGVSPGALSLGVEVAGALGAAFAGALVVDLALTVPDAPRALDRGPIVRLVPAVAFGVVGVAGVLAALPVFSGTMLGLQTFARVPELALFVGLGIASILRLLRRRLGSAPEALASNTWPLVGLAFAGTVIAIGAALATRLDATTDATRGGSVGLALALLGSHLALIDGRLRLRAGPMTRTMATTALTLGAVGAAAAWLLPRLPSNAATLGVATLLAVFAALAVHALASPFVKYVLAPNGARLLDAIDAAERTLGDAASLEEVGRAALAPLRRAARAESVEVVLYTVDPPRAVRADAAGEAHVKNEEAPEPVRRWVLDRPGEVAVRSALEGLVVRRPDLRPLVEILEAMDALAVVPLVRDGEVEGVLIVPRGARRSTPSLEEIAALSRLGYRLAGIVGILSATARAQRRASDVLARGSELEERIEALEGELDRARARVSGVEPAPSIERSPASLVAYSPRMRALVDRVHVVAPLDAAVLLSAEVGADTEPIARLLHGESGRSAGPFVVADCASVREDDARAALFGRGGPDAAPGWLGLAESGTLLLLDVPALPLDVQRDLAESLATREARTSDASFSRPIDIRLVATSRVDVAMLTDAGAFDPELARWLSALRLDVPPLRERAEDLPSLVLFALDRARRVLGRAPIGIDPGARDVLVAHPWSGGVRELDHVVERAVARASGSKVVSADLPVLVAAPPEVESAGLDGTYAELERRVLLRALDRAAGNKSEAARLLGLPRTTFLDKLRRAGLAVSADERDSVVS